MTKTQHVHKYKRIIYKSGNAVFFCALPDCSNKINPVLALGKRSICWRCEEVFILSEYSLRLAKPHCDACHKTKKVDIKLEEIGITTTEGYTQVTTEQNKSFVGFERKEPISLSERLQQTIQQAQEKQEDEL